MEAHTHDEYDERAGQLARLAVVGDGIVLSEYAEALAEHARQLREHAEALVTLGQPVLDAHAFRRRTVKLRAAALAAHHYSLAAISRAERMEGLR